MGKTKEVALMNRTRIDWCTHSANPVKGYCPVDCKDTNGKGYCYARRLYDRYGWDKTIRFEPSALKVPRKPGARIFVGSTIELFGPWVAPEWMDVILAMVRAHPEHTFIFLTKRPHELRRYNPWPGNVWLGTSIDHPEHQLQRMDRLFEATARVRFVSFEPLLGSMPHLENLRGIQWIIIGAQTGPGAVKPELAWVRDIMAAADEAGAKVFLKDNLLKLYPELPRRQELPEYPETVKPKEATE